MGPNRTFGDQLRKLEEALWRPETRFDTEWVRTTLSPNFRERGRSGRIYNLEEVLSVKAEEIPADLPLPDFAVTLIRPDVALVTYTSVLHYASGTEVSNRSSLWVQTKGQWRLHFHQGTPVPFVAPT